MTATHTPLDPELSDFVDRLDAAVEAHMEWSRRLLRCAVLRVSPGDDVLSAEAHRLCRFGRWFQSAYAQFEALDADAAAAIAHEHEAMHAAVRAICDAVLKGQPGSAEALDTFERTQRAFIDQLAHVKTLALATAVRHDALTGLPMRYGIERDFALCRADALRHGERLWVLMLDIDHFKAVNDRYGHPAGDAVLVHFAQTLRKQLRKSEPLYRFGGEEFLVLLRTEDAAQALRAAERLRAAVARSPATLPDGRSLSVSFTAGLAPVGAEEELSTAVARADAALYRGKEAGRDRVVLAE